MNKELKSELDLKFNHLGNSEFTLAYSKAGEKTAAAIAELIEEHRKQFARGRITSVGSAEFATVEVWRDIAAESDRAARAELLALSPELAQLTELEANALAAKQAADAKERELTALYSEWFKIPERVDAINEKLDAIARELASLDTAKIEENFRQLYRATLNGGAMADPFAQMQLAGLLVTAPLRKEVLEKLTIELEAELAELRARSKVLAKKLGQKSTI